VKKLGINEKKQAILYLPAKQATQLIDPADERINNYLKTEQFKDISKGTML